MHKWYFCGCVFIYSLSLCACVFFSSGYFRAICWCQFLYCAAYCGQKFGFFEMFRSYCAQMIWKFEHPSKILVVLSDNYHGVMKTASERTRHWKTSSGFHFVGVKTVKVWIFSQLILKYSVLFDYLCKLSYTNHYFDLNSKYFYIADCWRWYGKVKNCIHFVHGIDL